MRNASVKAAAKIKKDIEESGSDDASDADVGSDDGSEKPLKKAKIGKKRPAPF